MDHNNQKPIFYDEGKKRWPRVKYGSLAIFFSLFLIFGVFIFSLFIDTYLRHIPTIPSLYQLHYIKPHDTADNGIKKASQKPEKMLLSGLTSPGLTTKPLKRMAFLPHHDVAALNSLRQNLSKLDVVFIEGVAENPKTISALVKEIHQKNPNAKALWVLQKEAVDFLATPSLRQQLINHELHYVQQNHFNGIDIHFEKLTAQHRHDLVLFMQELASVFHAHNLSVSLNVYADDPAYDYKLLAHMADYLVLLAFDEHWLDSAAGPVASLSWYVQKINSMIKEVPADKLVVSLANYGYDWSNQTKQAQRLKFSQIMAFAKLANAQITLDPASHTPFFHYQERNNAQHQVWFLDAVTFFNQSVLAQSLHPAGIALWQLGSEDPSVWSVFDAVNLNKAQALQLSEIDPKNSLSTLGKPESDIFMIKHTPEVGYRDIVFDDDTGLIRDASYKKFPIPYIIQGYATQDRKKIALTFDDGPNAKYTPQILDILKATQTPATFFVIGRNILNNTDLLRREIAEGHDIGNHTYTHPDISQISETTLLMELASTERLIESSTGRSTLLFRAPFGVATMPTVINEIKPIATITQNGYYTVGIKIDPQDWSRPGADVIVKRVLDQVHTYDSNVVLLHDGGGSRQQTVEALPKIIAALKQEGYQFVSISGLMNIDRDVVMPPQPSSWYLSLSRVSFKLLQFFSYFIPVIYVVGILIVIVRFLVLTLLSLYQRKMAKISNTQLDNNLFSLAVIVPAYNESYGIIRTILSLLAAKHPERFEIIVVNDGSTDDTLQILQDNFGDNPQVKILSQQNAGKAAALNMGINHTKADFVTIIDGDTLIHHDTLNLLMYPLHDPKVGAVAGNIRVINQSNIMTKWQVLEYATGQSLDRRALSVLDAVVVVPGALGCWRREALVAAGGFTADTLAEDADMTIKVKRLGYRIAVAHGADAYTEVPETIKAFLRQRFRWMYGTYQVVWKHLDAFFKPRYGALGFIALPNLFLVHVILPLIAPLTDLIFILVLLGAFLNLCFGHTFTQDDLIYLKSIAWFYVLFTGMDLLTTLLAFCLDGKEKKRYLFWLIPQRFFYKQLIYFVAFQSVLAAMHGRKVEWGRMIRKRIMGV